MLQNIRVGWNLGNTFEAVPEETSWGNPRTSQKLIDFVKSLGFNAIRIPIAVNAHTDKNNNISKAWLKRVAQVVDYCIKDSMYVILSCSYTEGRIKFDGGKDYDLKQIVAIRNIWEQIAMQMAAYDEHLIFAFASRLSVSDISYLDKFILLQQNFIDAVRQTGGKNMYRTLLIQGPNLDMAETVKYMHLPSDYNEGYLGVEVAYYTPWNF
ncbi:MAG: cellulase family glycosylhydrolase, partial [Bacteroidaceae bacterium]|nr:cellulase family glycosylhydrolase [Bacteroidaceae bacterium]